MAVEFPDIRYRNNVVDCNIKLDRIARNINKAQFMLDTQIMNDMKPYMPLDESNFIDRTAAESMAIVELLSQEQRRMGVFCMKER